MRVYSGKRIQLTIDKGVYVSKVTCWSVSYKFLENSALKIKGWAYDIFPLRSLNNVKQFGVQKLPTQKEKNRAKHRECEWDNVNEFYE